MKLKLPTILFGAALSITGLAMTSPQAWAANTDVSSKVNATGQIKTVGNFSVDLSGSSDGIEATDYILINIKNVAINNSLNGQKVEYNGNEIGTISIQNVTSKFTEVVNKDVNDSVVPAYSSGQIKITFNENIAKVDDFTAALSSLVNIDYWPVDHDYTLDSAITIGGKTITTATTEVRKANERDHTDSSIQVGGIYYNVNNDSNTFAVELRSNGKNPLKAGDKMKVCADSNSNIKFKDTAAQTVNVTHHQNFVSADTPKNANGVYFTRSDKFSEVKVTVEDGCLVYEVLQDFPTTDATGVVYLNNIYEIVNYEENNASGQMGVHLNYTNQHNKSTASYLDRGQITWRGVGVDAYLTERINRQIDRPETVPQTIKVGETPDPKAHIENFDELYPGCSVRYKTQPDNTKPGEFEVELIISCSGKDDLEVTAILIIEEDEKVEETPEIKEEPKVEEKKEELKIEAPHTGLDSAMAGVILSVIAMLGSTTLLAFKRR